MINNICYHFFLKTPRQPRRKSEKETSSAEEQLHPIYFRIRVNGIRREISSGEVITAGSWNPAKNRAKEYGEKSQLINARLDLFLANAKRATQFLSEQKRPISAQSIKNQMLGKDTSSTGIVHCFENLVREITLKVGIDYEVGTLKIYEATLKHLKVFIAKLFNVPDLPLKDLNYKFITDFELMCKTDWDCKKNSTVNKHIQRIRTAVGIAIANEWLDKGPFFLYKAKHEKGDVKFLTLEELDAIMAKEFTIERLEKVRDVFIFSCYTGYSYAEVRKFTPHDIVTGMDGLKWI